MTRRVTPDASPFHYGGQWLKGSRHQDRQPKTLHRLMASPCLRPPLVPADLIGTFVKHPGRKRHNRWTMRMRWTEVTTDTSGFTISIKSYAVEIQASADGSNWFLSSRHHVPGKDDGDPGDKDHLIVHHIQGNLAYRYRVRSITKECKSDWSEFYLVGLPNDGPPAPHDVKIFRAPHGIRLHWAIDQDPIDDELFTEDVAYFVSELWNNPDFGPSHEFSATAGDDKFAVYNHGFANGDPVMISRNSTPNIPHPESNPDSFPGGVKPWKCYLVSNVTQNTFKLIREEDADPINITSDGTGSVHWGLVRKARHLHRHHHLFRIDANDFDEDYKFYGRVRSVSDHRSKSPYIPATAPAPNDDPDAVPTGRKPAWVRRVFTFSPLDPITEGTYRRPTRVDDDYTIRRVTASFHKASTGGYTKFDIKINGDTYVFGQDGSKMVAIANGERDGTSKQIVNGTLERGDYLRVVCGLVAPTPPSVGTIHIICDRRKDGATTDSGGGGGE